LLLLVADSYMTGMTDELDDPFLCTELFGFEGSLFDPREMERLKLKHEVGLWFWWSSDWQEVLLRDPAYFKWKAGPFL